MKIKFNIKREKEQQIIFQLAVLIISTFAFAYLVSQTNSPSTEDFDKKENKIFVWILGEFSKESFSLISAQDSSTDISLSCCTETKNGAICQNLPYSSNECSNDLIPTTCNQVSECKLGTCIDQEGLCTPRATKQQCESNGGLWKDDSEGNIQECVRGCCLLGNSASYVTEQRCEVLSSYQGFTKEFQDVQTEIECLALKASQEVGACVYQAQDSSNKNDCRQISEVECLKSGGRFYRETLCSNPSLNTKCEKQEIVNCVEGKDEIYWFDSCGNRENIYSSDKDASWNEGRMLSKEESCNPNLSNSNSDSCGNCNYFLGSFCSASSSPKISDGNFVCKDLSCTDPNSGERRENGESWCVYDSYIGEGKDTVGSRHWKQVCINGEIEDEPCADYRGQICVESEITEGDLDFNQASCIINRATECISYNQNEETMEENCNRNSQCMINNVDVDDDFKFSLCVPKYPKGFDLSPTETTSISNQICSIANQKCTVIYKKELDGDWKCVANCDCEKRQFAEEMNDLCISLGDCGSYINFVGEGTDNVNVQGSSSISWENYKQYATPVPGQKAEIGNITEYLESIGWSLNPTPEDPSGMIGLVSTLGTVSGALGVTAVVASAIIIGSEVGLGVIGTAQLTVDAIMGTASGSIVSAGGGLTGTLFSFGAALSAIAVLAGATYLMGSLLGLTPEAMNTLMTIGLATAVVATFISHFVFDLAYFGWAGVIGLVVAAIVAVILRFLGVGETKKKIVSFECLPWQAPIGGSNCDECNSDPLKPCTKYRCQSLGASCGLLNENTENPVCVDTNPDDTTPPIISAGNISEGFKYENENLRGVSVRADNGECIQEFTPVTFSLETDEYAQCRIAYEHTALYRDMNNYPDNKNLFSLNHPITFMMPSIESLEVYGVTGDLRQRFGNFDIFVRCQDNKGNFNLQEYTVNLCIKSGPDTTPPRILETNPVNGKTLKVGTNEKEVKIYLNEPAECKYDSSDKDYDLMQKTMSCNTDLEDVTGLGWECKSNLTINSGDNKVYFRCKDQPWLTEEQINEGKTRNTNQQGHEYSLVVSQNELKIDSITPSGEIVDGFEPITVNLQARTSGGSENGKAVCSYSFSGYERMIQFFETYSTNHKQVFNLLAKGNYNVYVKCIDEAENIALGSTNFTLNLDTSPPIVTRVYNSGSQMKVITNEPAACYYSFESCSFDLKNGTSMTTAYSKEHTASWQTSSTYYIKCEDIFKNQNIGCALMASPSEI